MQYEVLLFDADETLFDFKKAERYALERLIASLEVVYDKGYHPKMYAEINKDVWHRLEQGAITAQELKIERATRLIEALEVEANPEDVSERYLDYLADASFLYEEALEILEYLHKKYRLAIITNGLSAVQNKRIRQSKVASFFEHITISEEINVAKPNPKIFEHTLEQLSYEEKVKVLMIGDSLTSDIQGGINFGIDTCWFNSKGIKNTGNYIITHEISNLKELKELL